MVSKEWSDKLERLHEKLQKGEISRRDFVKQLVVAGAAVGLVGGPFGSLALAAKKSIRFDGWGGVVSEAFRKNAFDPFQKATGVEVIDGEFGSTDTYLTRVKASFPPGGEFNLAHLSGVFDYERYVKLGFGAAIDESKIPNLKLVMPALMEPFRKISGGTLACVPYDYGQTGIAYNSKFVTKEKAEKLGAGLLFEESLKGKLGSWSDIRTNMWYACLYTGQDPNNIADIDKVWEALRKQVPLMKKYWDSGAELMSLLANEEIYVTTAWSGRVAALQADGHPIEFLSLPGTFSWQECIFVMKGTDMDVANDLLNFMLEPACAIAVALGQKYPPALDPTKVDLPEEVKKLPAFDPTGTLKGYTWISPEYWNTNQPNWMETWDRIRSGA
jgi:spermidine/putrescine transport system substrate-binding protein